MSQDTGFINDWFVREFVFHPEGAYAGEVRQRRTIHRINHDTLRVHQECVPEARLKGTIMEAFKGSYSFNLKTSGHRRIYLGPDVVGEGLALGDGRMIGTGLWPRFGHNFHSYGIVTRSGLQLTGGEFYSGPQLGSFIIGVAQPGSYWAGDISDITTPNPKYQSYIGEASLLNNEGKTLWQGSYDRRYHQEASGFTDTVVDKAYTTSITEQEGRQTHDHQGFIGIAKTYGSSQVIKGFRGQWSYSAHEIMDPDTRNLHIIIRLYKDQQWRFAAIVNLKPERT